MSDSERDVGIDTQVERLNAFLHESLPEIEKVLTDYRQECNPFEGTENVQARSNMHSPPPSFMKENIMENHKNSDVSTPLITSVQLKTTQNESTIVSDLPSRTHLTGHSTLIMDNNRIPVSSLETMCFLDNVQDMLNNIRDYADYISDHPLHRDDLLNKVNALLGYCHDICIGIPDARTCLPGSQMLLFSDSYPTWIGSASFSAALPLRQISSTSRGSLGATPIPRLHRDRKVTKAITNAPQ